MRPAVFLDRDGVLNEVLLEDGQAIGPRSFADFRLANGAADAVARLTAAGKPVFVVTNQPDVARGLLDPFELERMLVMLREAMPVDDVAVCPHDDGDGCDCRKPKPGMLTALARRHGIDLLQSVMVGDTWKDMEAGRRAGCRTILLRRPYNQAASGDLSVDTLGDAVSRILEPVKAAG